MNGKTSKLIHRYAHVTVPRDYTSIGRLINPNDVGNRRMNVYRRHLNKIKRAWLDMSSDERASFRIEMMDAVKKSR